jgi:hypothetical protein
VFALGWVFSAAISINFCAIQDGAKAEGSRNSLAARYVIYEFTFVEEN